MLQATPSTLHNHLIHNQNVNIPPVRHLIAGLEPYTPYDVRVACRSSQGASPWTSWVTLNTSEGGKMSPTLTGFLPFSSAVTDDSACGSCQMFYLLWLVYRWFTYLCPYGKSLWMKAFAKLLQCECQTREEEKRTKGIGNLSGIVCSSDRKEISLSWVSWLKMACFVLDRKHQRERSL